MINYVIMNVFTKYEVVFWIWTHFHDKGDQKVQYTVNVL